MTNLSAVIEALLFAAGDPVEVEKLAEATQVEPAKVEQALSDLADDYVKRLSGLRIVKLGKCYQLCSDTQYAQQIRSLLEIKRNQPLSQAAFEVLAVIAYNQPVTKAFIEQVRGVDCSGVIATLTQKNLIEERGRLDLPGRPLLYGTTADFLRCFMLEGLDDLPEVPESEKPQTDEDENQISLQEVVEAQQEQEEQETSEQN